MTKRRYQAFVSSTYTDLIEERKAVTQAILENNCFPAGMELFPASSKSQWEIIKNVIDESDIYILILAGRYGTFGTDEDGLRCSYTEMEFDYAAKTGKPVIALIRRDIDDLPRNKTERSLVRITRLKLFREKAMRGRLVKFWSNQDNLKAEASHAISTMIHDPDTEMSGWIYAKDLQGISENQTKQQAELKAQLDKYQRMYENEVNMHYESLKSEDELKEILFCIYDDPQVLELDQELRSKIEKWRRQKEDSDRNEKDPVSGYNV